MNNINTGIDTSMEFLTKNAGIDFVVGAFYSGNSARGFLISRNTKSARRRLTFDILGFVSVAS